MRKRIAIGLLLVSVVGVVVFFVSQPRKGSLEWHEQKYERLMREIEGRTLKHRGLVLWRKATGTRMSSRDLDRTDQIKQMLEHWRSLLECGYFVERRFVVKDADARAKISVEWKNMIPKNRQNYTQLCGVVDTDALLVIGRPKDMPLWEHIIREGNIRDWGDLLVPRIGVPGDGR